LEVLLTERLVCPRCGPPFGLVLLAQRVEARRVLEGSLGCPNCRDRFPVVEGFGDLRPPPRDELARTAEATGVPDPEETLRLAALLGITTGPARVALLGSAAAHAPALVGLIPELEAIVVGPTWLPGPEVPGVSRMAAGPRLPFQSRALQGAAASGPVDVALMKEAFRVGAPGARIVLLGAPSAGRETAQAAGLEILLEQGGFLVAATPGPRASAGGFKLPVVKGR
jgi:uncharacterized protein YbaR (Trm112 family)